MIDGLVFADSKDVLFDLINGTTHVGAPVRAVTWLPAGAYGAIDGPFPLAHIQGRGGEQGAVDRVERRTIDVYAPGEQALDVLESICASIYGTDIETPSGYVDKIAPDVTPDDASYQSDTLNRATATVLVTLRPLN
jgi:hypothetical protein